MADIYQKIAIQNAIQSFSFSPLQDAATAFFACLGYKSDRTIALDSVEVFCQQFDPSGVLAHPRAQKSNWKSIHLLFQLTDEELSHNATLFKDTTIRASLLQSYVFFAVELQPGDYARGKLAAITRQINRIFPMPVMVLFKVAGNLSIAVINRRQNKRDESKDVLGKVTLIQNISTVKPHPGHLDILASFSTTELLARKKPIGNFDQLHAAWEDVFNVELLNKRFYEELSNWYFWARKQVSFPSDLEPDEDTRNATSVIRLLTRLIFCWFLKEKDLIPNHLFEPDAISEALISVGDDESTYYHAILQNLFFATLNQPMNADGEPIRQFAADGDFQENRNQHGVKTLYRYKKSFRVPDNALSLFEDIPFLNGGLFACLDTEDDTGKVQYADGFSRNPKKQPIVPNRLFFSAPHVVDLSDDFGDAKKKKASVRGLLHILHGYKFTIAESTPVEQEIALDPELLGNVFENLLASYNPETGTNARRQTGSFYTPRPIVDYMVDESLKAYLTDALVKALPATTRADAKAGLDILFAYTEKEHAFSEAEIDALITAINACNILDPACGSGAYPMGILHKLVFILGKLDPHNEKWHQRQVAKAEEIEDVQARETSVQAINNDFANNALDYGRKLYLIENCIYGADIQPIAIQISKLRFFISLICDQRTHNDKARNLGVRPLPNLETKFVAANTLLGLNLPKNRSLFENETAIRLEKELEKVRHSYFSAQTRKAKLALQKKDRDLTKKIIDELKHDSFGNEDVYRRIAWNPYDHHSVADFFDPGKMFGPALDDGFDVVIGNPPYVQIQKFSAAHKAAWVEQKFKTYAATADIYCLFYERGVRLLKDGGQLSYITSNKWMRAGYGEKLRGFFCKDVAVEEVIDFGGVPVFNAAMVDTAIVRLAKSAPKKSFPSSVLTRNFSIQDSLPDYVQDNAVPFVCPADGAASWVIMSPERFRIKCAVEAQGVPLEKWQIQINYGIKTGYNEAFYISTAQRDAFIAEDPRCADLIVPLLRGRYVERYATQWAMAEDEQWMINSHNGVKELGIPPVKLEAEYPVLWNHLVAHEEKLAVRLDKGDHWSNLRNCAYIHDFQKPKIVYPNMTKYLPFYLDTTEHFFINDKAFILTSEAESLTYLTAALNSTVFRCCFMDNFPNLGEDRRELRKIFMDKIPIKKPSAQQASLFEALIPMVQASKLESQKSDGSDLKSVAVFLEEVIDACVMEVYFADHMAEHHLGIMAHVTPLLQDVDAAAPPAKQVAAAQQFYAQANDSKHPIRNILIRIPVDSPDLLAVIQREGAV
ncbi:Eco57I restriction-modification methylase domain-containing protein [Rhodoferax sp.]|uniref:Eco57I restriction-modification methylase domain-containing protein n=1 Tax=Rhodoferax sp. TaxID=50421 RepID=UPI0026212DE2|nr:Eco57I restriction-modification methylase domain-containing protein [Rhodoferax sp.]MDD5479140.1 Eco57I restriction-modification methylase domain-containing protein [Rhodoferax sp.]